MSKIKKAKLIENVNGQKIIFVAGVNDENDIYSDVRSKRPVGIEQNQDIIYVQELNKIEFASSNNEQKNVLTFIAPNNVGVLLSIANRALDRARVIYDEEIDPDSHQHVEMSTVKKLMEDTLTVYEFIESIQTCIVFGYTAIEAFVNLSIDRNYEYRKKIDNKGIIEVYDKKAIERWISLRDKISEILSEIYDCKSIKQDKLWSKFQKFEECRNQIIHQKSLDVNSFYEQYFNQEIFELCCVPQKVIRYYFQKGKEQEITSALWPIVDGDVCDIAIFRGPNANLVKYVGSFED